MLFALFLILPTAATLSLWLVGDIIIRVQVFLEEKFLMKSHGDSYQKYIQQVRRWL